MLAKPPATRVVFLLAVAAATRVGSNGVSFEPAHFRQVLPPTLLPILDGHTKLVQSAEADKSAMLFIQTALREVARERGWAGSWQRLMGKYGPKTVRAIKDFSDGAVDGKTLDGKTLRDLLQYHPDLQKLAQEVQRGRSIETALLTRANEAEQRDESERAILLWQGLLRLDPSNVQGNRALGMAFSYRDEFEAAMPHLREALVATPADPTLNQYAGINLKIWADRLPETEQQRKHEMMTEAAHFCEVSRKEQLHTMQGGTQAPTWNDRFFYIHCCEPYDTLGRPQDKALCIDEALARGLWKNAKQRPGRYDPRLRAAPWWTPAEMGRSTDHVHLLQKNWKLIRKEARRVLAAAAAASEDGALAGGAEREAGFRLEGAGLHAQKSWSLLQAITIAASTVETVLASSERLPLPYDLLPRTHGICPATQ